MDALRAHPHVGLFDNVATNLRFPFTGIKRPKHLAAYNASVHKARPIMKWVIMVGEDEHKWPAQSPDLMLMPFVAE